MKVSLKARVTITASQADVFTYLTNLKYHFLWNPHLQNISPQTMLTQGMTYKTTSMLLGIKVRGNNKATKFIPNQEIELENKSGALQYEVNYQLIPVQNKTLILCTTTVSVDSKAFILTAPVLKMLARRELQSDLQALKIAVEQRLK